ncbi:hypothetical protein ZWY2020_009014 [Hordeum vulgare]|nr:hypothetical protein ZWY2020_009014 [Hordeum vulgare]
MEEVDGLRELARLPDVMVVCSSAGWTDQKHMLYLGLLQESFVNRLHDGEIGFRGLFHLSPGPRASTPKQPSKADRAKVGQGRPPCSGNHGDGETISMEEEDDDASSQVSGSQSSATTSRPSSPCHFGKRGCSPSSTAEGSDQNFVDKETIARETGESRGRPLSNKRLKVC